MLGICLTLVYSIIPLFNKLQFTTPMSFSAVVVKETALPCSHLIFIPIVYHPRLPDPNNSTNFLKLYVYLHVPNQNNLNLKVV